jgi:hypothetical protein
MHGMYIEVEGFAHLGRLYAPRRQIATPEISKVWVPQASGYSIGNKDLLDSGSSRDAVILGTLRQCHRLLSNSKSKTDKLNQKDSTHESAHLPNQVWRSLHLPTVSP